MAATGPAALLRECSTGCSVVLTFDRCGAYATDQDAASTVRLGRKTVRPGGGARGRALSECRSRGGSGCSGVRAWGAAS